MLPQEGDLELDATASGPTIEFKNVTFTYPGKTQPALDNLSLKLESGDLAIIVGTNGSGNTTFIKLLCRFFTPTRA